MKFLDSWAVKSGRAQEWKQEGELRGILRGRQEGMQEGMQRGELRGRQEERQQIFAALQQQGYDINLIKSKLPREFA